MNKPVGGRGKKAPYETQVMRVPIPIASQVEQFIENYRISVTSDEDVNLEEKTDVPAETAILNYSDALQRAKEIVNQGKSARISLAKLLQVLYGGRVRPEDLK